MSVETLEPQTVVLVITDNTFASTVDDLEGYLTKLKTMLASKGKSMVTITGRFGLHKVDESITALEIEDRNKTVFTHGLENIITYYDEILLITLYDKTCSFMAGAVTVATDNSKTITKYSYLTKKR